MCVVGVCVGVCALVCVGVCVCWCVYGCVVVCVSVNAFMVCMSTTKCHATVHCELMYSAGSTRESDSQVTPAPKNYQPQNCV